MLKGRRCEHCTKRIRTSKARHRQTKYCELCAKIKKKENTLDPWLPEERREYMRNYMRSYRRRHPKLSTPYVRKYRKKRTTRFDSKDAEPQVKRNRCADATKVAPFPLVCVPLILTLFLPGPISQLNYEAVSHLIKQLHTLVLEATGLAVIIILCWHHLVAICKKK
jgi:hypothetical protein